MLRRFMPVAVLLALFASANAAQAATIWTPVSSGTSQTISSIVYQSPARFWYATTAGTIAFWNGASFTAASGVTPGEDFVDLAFQPTSVPGGPGTSGLVGLAVAENGDVWRSTDGGASWSQLGTLTTRSDCSNLSAPEGVTELNAVQWANPTTAYLLGNKSTIMKSLNAGLSFTEINKNVSGTCAVQSESFTENMTDATFLPANPNDALFVAQDFGRVYRSSNGATTGSLLSGGTVNAFQGNPRIAQDAADPSRVWVVDHAVSSGSGCGTLCLEVSGDGGNTFGAAKFANDSSVVGGLYDISSQGGVEVTAGTSGEIFTSVDGSTFYDQPAEGALAGENWRAEAAFDAQHAAVGGEGGALMVTAAANTVPAAPAGPNPGPGVKTPTSPALGPPTFSGAVRTSTGGARITIYKVVTVTGRNARFVPVVVSTTKPRKFTVQILALKGKKPLATGQLTLKHKHGGHGTIRVKLPASVKPGTYFVVVRETTLKGAKVGKPIKVKFTLK